MAVTSNQQDDSSEYLEPEIKGSEKKSVAGAWFGVVVTCGFIAWFFWKSEMPLFMPGGYPDPLLYLMGLVSLFVLGRAIRGTIRLKRFGDPPLELNGGKGTIGGAIEGRLGFDSGIGPAPEFTLKLTCIHRLQKMGDKHPTETILWSAEQKASLLIGGILPISISIPAGQPPTRQDDPFDVILWRLTVKAPFRGIAFSEKYEIPVYGGKG